MALSHVPYILRHTTIAIFSRADTAGSGLKKFENAFNIARWALAQQGYLSKSSVDGPSYRIKLTGKGQKREGKHGNEGAWKNKLFNELFAEWEAHNTQEKKKQDKSPKGGTKPDEKPDKAKASRIAKMLGTARKAKKAAAKRAKSVAKKKKATKKYKKKTAKKASTAKKAKPAKKAKGAKRASRAKRAKRAR
jgi:hypothetical protein